MIKNPKLKIKRKESLLPPDSGPETLQIIDFMDDNTIMIIK